MPEFAVRLGRMERRQGLGMGVWFRILHWEDSWTLKILAKLRLG